MKKFLFTIGLSFFSFVAFCQWTGATSVTSGQTVTYTLADEVVFPNYSFVVTGGNLISTSRSGTNYTVKVTWVGGVGGIDFYMQPGNLEYHLNVTITGCAYTSPSTPATPAVSSNTCGNKTISFNGTPPAGYSWYWQTTATGTETTSSSSSYTVSSSGDYYLRSKASCGANWSSSASVTVTINPEPSIPTAADVTICPYGTGVLSPVPGSNGNSINWYGASAGGTPVYNGPTLTITNENGTPGTTTYYVATLNTANGCESTLRKSISLIVKSATIPSLPVNVTNGNSCGPGTVNLSATPGANGDNIRWYSNGSQVATGVNYAPNVSATTTFYASSYSSTTGCESSGASPVIATINPNTPSQPPAPVVSSSTCSTKTISFSGTAPTGYAWYWQTSGTGTDLTLSSSSYTVSSSGTYYLRSKALCGPYWSSGVSIDVIVNLPSPPSVVHQAVCGPQSITLTATPGSNGNSINWYDATDALVGTGTSLSVGTVSATKSYYPSTVNTTTGCISASAIITVTVNPIPLSPTVNNQAVCGPASITLTGTPGTNGNTINWYNSSGTSIGTGNSLPVGLVSATTAYSARTINTTTTCSSPVSNLTVAINQVPLPPIVNNQAFCGPSSVTLLGTPNNFSDAIYWYNSSNVRITPGVPTEDYSLSLGLISATTTYYAREVAPATNCISALVPVTISINPVPSAPTVNNQALCGPTNVTLSGTPGANGNTINWYNTSNTLLGSGSNFMVGTVPATSVYTARSSNATTGCVSPVSTAASATVTIRPVPTASVSAANSTLCSGSTATITVSNPNNLSGTTLAWTASTTNATVPALSGTGNITGPFFNDGISQGSVTYTVTPYTSLCTGTPVTATVAIKTSATMPNLDPLLVYGNGPVTFHIPVPTGDQANWFSYYAAPTPVSTQPSLTITYNRADTLNSLMYVSLKDLTSGCETQRVLFPVSYVKAVNPSSVTEDVVRVPGVFRSPDLDNLSDALKTKTISFMDGLGRTSQVIAMKATRSGNALVQPVEYDSYGRASKTYLPYADTASGHFKTRYSYDQASFYGANSPAGDKIANDSYPYAAARYEASPLGRALEQGSPGTAWQLGNHTNKLAYSYNTGATSGDAEEVRIFAPDGSSAGFYAANLLAKTIATDENGNVDMVFTNFMGRTIAKKQQVGGTTYLQTYYVYDDLDRLKYIIPPAAYAYLKSQGWAVAAATVDNYFHQFLYDNRGRLTQKKTPGQAWSYFVYDNMNRLILSQDGNQRPQGKWAFIKYDQLGRAVMSGLYTNAALTDQASALTLLNSNTALPYYEKRTTGSTGYTNQAFPTANTEVWSIDYYDDYNFKMNSGSAPVYDNAHLAGLPPQATAYLRGRATGSSKRIVGTANWITGAVFYDNYGRVIQTQGNNHLNLTGLDKGSTVYDFEGKVLQTKTTHSPNSTAVTNVLLTPVYDAQGRLYQVNHSINGAANQLVAQYEYNELGQRVTKKLHYTSGSFLQNVDLRYNIRGWLTSINNAQLANDGGVTNSDSNDYFGMELGYEADAGIGNTARYNGNLSAIKWKNPGASSGAADQRSYRYTYDQADRLTAARFAANTGGGAWTKEANVFNESMSYDPNGNIKTLGRNQRSHQLSGLIASYASETTDSLTYTYNPANGDQLQKVTDAATPLIDAGFKNGNSGTNNDYTYDVNGNVQSDLNKGISGIIYNLLGKPAQINFTDGKKIDYTYDATGNKLTMKTWQGTSLLVTTDYVNGFQYENGSLRSYASPEGRVVMKGTTPEYQYAIADQQGNTRLVFSSAPVVADTKTAGLEEVSNTDFQNYPTGGSRNSVSIYNHTTGGTYSQLLNGGNNSQVGLAKSYKVYPGDKVKIAAYAKYANPTSNSSNVTAFASALLNAFLLPAPIGGELGTASSALNSWGSVVASGGDGQSNAAPHVSVNIILFDKNYKFLDVSYDQIAATAQQVGVSPVVAHDYMTKEYTVKEEGYVFMYIANENATQVDAYFDDVAMTYTPTSVVQYNEYYAFGLQTSISWTRENNSNNFLYNEGSELNTTTGIYETMFRGYDATLGRFMQVDPLAHIDHSTSPFAYAGNNPIMFNDPMGLLVSVDGYSDAQIRSMYRRDRDLGGYSGGFGDWAIDNLVTAGGGNRTIRGTDGIDYAFHKDQFGYWDDDERQFDLKEIGVGGYKSTFVSLRDPNELGHAVNKAINDYGFVIGTVHGAFDTGFGEGLKSLERLKVITGRAASGAFITESRMAVSLANASKYKALAASSKVLRYGGMVLTVGVVVYNAYDLGANGGTNRDFAKLGLQTVIAGVGFLGPIGFGVSMGLTLIEMNGGFDWFYDNFDDNTMHKFGN